jgi:hypothetical protein
MRSLVVLIICLLLPAAAIAHDERLLTTERGGAAAAAGIAAAGDGRSYPLDGTPLVDAVLPIALARAAHAPPAPLVTDGAAMVFYTIDLVTHDFVAVQASLRAESATTIVFVEDAQWGTRVSQTDVDAILAAFDEQTPPASIDPGSGIADIVEAVYGPPTDIDQDGKIHILILDIRDGWSGSGGYVAGYYTSHDQTSAPYSNQRDLIYIDCQPADPTGSEVLGTVAHEYQHLVHFGADPDEGSSTPFMNEALSELSTYLCGYGLRSPASFAVAPDIALDDWHNDESDYARVALWSLYIYEQLGLGAIQAIFADPGNGVSGVESALAAIGSQRDFATLAADWFVANAVGDLTLDPRYGYQAWSGTVTPVASHVDYPVADGGTVEHRAADVVRLRGSELSLAVTQPAGVGLRARAVARNVGRTAMVVDELVLGTTWDAGEHLADVDDVLLVLFTTGVFDAEYAYEAGALPANVVELAYDDGTAEFLGVLPPAEYDRGLAVRFTCDSDATLLRTLRIYFGDPTPVDVHVWAAGAQGPGADLSTPLRVEPPATAGWYEIDLTEYGIELSQGDFYAGVILPGGSADRTSVALDEQPPHAQRSWLLDSGIWNQFDDIGLEYSDLMMRAEVEYPPEAPPEFTLGVLHQPVFSQELDVYVVSETAMNLATLTGVFEHAGESTTLEFADVSGDQTVFVADGATLTGGGPARVVVSGAAQRGVEAATDSLEFEAAWLGSSGGMLALGGAEVVLPSDAIAAAELCTAQPGGVYPGGPGFLGASMDATVTFGPIDLPLLRPATVRLPGSAGVIARWSGGAWVPLVTTARGSHLETSTVALGSFRVLSGQLWTAPAAFRVVPLTPNPVGSEALLGLELGAPAARVRMTVYDVLGRSIAQLRDGAMSAGSHVIPVSLGNRPAGIYWVETTAGSERSVVKLVSVR